MTDDKDRGAEDRPAMVDPGEDAVGESQLIAAEPTTTRVSEDGVGESHAGPADPSRRELVKWAWRLPVLAVAGGAAYGIYEAARVHFLKPEASENPEFDPRPATRVAELSSFATDWDAVYFELAGAPSLPSVAIRVPERIPGGLTLTNPVGVDVAHFAAFSRICTHQYCIVSFNADVNAINFAFNYQGQHPAITCPCHLSVFDPLRAGRAVSGPAVTPLPRVRLAFDGDLLLADGLERT